jgi:predicted ArsR family transcriptional regulator
MRKRREATPDEARALANPLRLRILRLCLDEALTNKEIADRLDRDPGSVLHHVRMLVDTDFLRVEPVRSGLHGALEKPYRATGKSWEVSVEDGRPEQAAMQLAMIDAFRDEVAESGPDAILMESRLGVRLKAADKAELVKRLNQLAEEFKDRDHPRGQPVSIFVAVARRVSGRGGSSARDRGSGSGGRAARANRGG